MATLFSSWMNSRGIMGPLDEQIGPENWFRPRRKITLFFWCLYNFIHSTGLRWELVERILSGTGTSDCSSLESLRVDAHMLSFDAQSTKQKVCGPSESYTKNVFSRFAGDHTAETATTDRIFHRRIRKNQKPITFGP